MTKPDPDFQRLSDYFADIPAVTAGSMFGAPCLKVYGKVFLTYHPEDVVFKLPPDALREALALPGAALFDPSGKGRPLREWVLVPTANQAHFETLAQKAAEYVGGKLNE